MDWELPLLCTVGMALAGAAILFGKDWLEKRKRQGLPLIPPHVASKMVVAFAISCLIFVVLCALLIFIGMLR